LISAAALASPWMIYQIWKFVSAGLYPRERKYITKYLPLSVGLLITGMVFMYFFVLPIMLDLFISFQIGPAMNFGGTVDKGAATRAAVIVPTLQGDPESPQQGEIWFDQQQRRIKVFVMGEVRVLPFMSENMVTPHIMLRDYVDMVVGLLLSFGLAFQMPLVVLALTRIGIMGIDTLRKWRRPMYMGMVVVAACIVPVVATGMIALAVPLVLLYEFGIWLSVMAERKAQRGEGI
jgi:Sec-independent protein secretion pathway component TatC